MSTKKKGQLTTSREWAKHLRKYLRRQFWKGERIAERKLINIEVNDFLNEPIIWTGDLSDDCTAEWFGLILRAEWMDEDYWWWAVYDMQKQEAIIDNSNNYKERFIDGEVSRKKAESVAHEYIADINSKVEIAKYFISDTFKIVSRGIVFAGYITKGTISIGDTIEFIAGNSLFRRRITGIDGMRKAHDQKVNTGLLINCNNENEIDYLKDYTDKNTVVSIYKNKE